MKALRFSWWKELVAAVLPAVLDWVKDKLTKKGDSDKDESAKEATEVLNDGSKTNNKSS
jgi:hypothetical protein